MSVSTSLSGELTSIYYESGYGGDQDWHIHSALFSVDGAGQASLGSETRQGASWKEKVLHSDNGFILSSPKEKQSCFLCRKTDTETTLLGALSQHQKGEYPKSLCFAFSLSLFLDFK